MSVFIYLIGFYKMAIILTTNTMGLLIMLCVGCLTIYSAATQCQDSQHCSECDYKTGHCITECDPGYYDHRCTSMCNKNCKNNICVTAYTGNEYCSEGCVPGYQGPGCGKPCYNPGDNCTACPGGCDGGYCQLGSSCVSGCVDSYYGTGCKNCSSGCTACNRKTGTCDEKQATKCNDNQHCSDCSSTTGHCITGCEPGHYDKKCMSVCSDNCRNKTCIMSNTGNDYCTDGCVPGYQGPGCGKPCYSQRGNCTVCPGECDGGYCQLGSSCYSGCVDSFYGTDCKNCSSGCTTCNRTTGTCDNKPDESMTYLRIGILASSLFLVLCVSVTIYTFFTKYLNRNREETHQEDEDDYLPNAPAEERVALDAFRHSNAMYSEVNESETGTGVVILEGRYSN